MAKGNQTSNLVLRTVKNEPLTFQEMDENLSYLNSLIGSKGNPGLDGEDGAIGITFSESDPVNPDNNPENEVWFKVDSDGITILKIFTWDEVNHWNIYKLHSGITFYINPQSTIYTGENVINQHDTFNTFMDLWDNYIYDEVDHYSFNNVNSGTVPESNFLELPEPIFDIKLHNFSLPGDRCNSYIRFYNEDHILLGHLKYQKNVSTWAKDDSTSIEFYDSQDTLILSIPSSQVSGDNYGNGALYGTFDLRDENQITLWYPASYIDLPSHFQHIDLTFECSNVLTGTKYITIEVYNLTNTYYSDGMLVFGSISPKFNTFPSRDI